MKTPLKLHQRLAGGVFRLALFLALGSAPCLAAATLSQQIDPPEANVGDQVTVSLTIQNGSVGDVHLPQVDGLELEGTSTSTGITIVNGSMSSTESISFHLAPTHAGDFTIPAFDIHTQDGGTLHAQPMKLHVLGNGSAPPATAPAPSNPPAPAPSLPTPTFNPHGPVVMPPANSQTPAPDASGNSADTGGSNPNVPRESDGRPAKVFNLITPQTTDAYVGQTIPMRIECYLRRDVAYQQNSLPTIKGSDFLMNDLIPRFREDAVNFAGEEYIRQTWVTAISAPKSGDFPLQMERDTYWIKSMSSTNIDPFGNFSINRPVLAHEPIDSNQLTIHVHSLPQEGRPANFTGAIGQLKATGVAQPLSVSVGEPVTLRFTITGEGNFDYVRCPSMTDDPAWKSYVPSSKIEYLDESHTQGVKTFDQAVIPQKNGTLPLPQASFSYFDPDAKQYVTLPIELPAVTVTGSIAAAPPAANADSASTAAPKATEFLPNRISIGSRQTSLTPAYRQTWFWAVQGGFTSSLLLSLLFIFFCSRARPDDDHAERLQRQNLLHQEEDAMTEAARQGDTQAFFIAARHTIQLQLGARWRLKPEALTLGEIHQRDPQLATTLEPLFAQTDEVIYSGGTSGNLDLAQWERHVRDLLQLQPA